MRTIPTTGLYVLEWSQSQNALHIQPLEKSMRAARERFSVNKAAPNDFAIVFLGDEDEVNQMAEQIRPLLRSREALEKAGAEQ